MALTVTPGKTYGTTEVVTSTNLNALGTPTIADGQTYPFGAGTVSAPSVTFEGDTDTGLYRSAADTLAVATAGVQRGTYNANGWNGNVVGNVTGNVTGNASGTAANVTGTVAVANGGTGATTATNARTNLGLGGASVLNVGTSSGTVCAGDDSRLTNSRQCNNSFDNATTSRTNLGLGSLATLSTVNNSNWSGAALAVANGGTGATSAAGARTAFGLGDAATQTYATGTWTPSIGGTAAYTTQEGTYTQIGRMVYVRGRIKLSSRGTGSQATISGLPVASARSAPIQVGYFDDAAASVSYLTGLASGTSITMYGISGTGGQQMTAVNYFNNISEIYFSGCYESS
jgi:hypothetical protein